MKLNLGSGPGKLDGYINVDIDEKCKPDVVWNLYEFPYPWDDDSIDEVLMANTIEHISYRYHVKIFEELYRILKPGGILTVVCPDITVLYEKYIRDKEVDDHVRFVHFLFGGHENEHDYHNSGYTRELMHHVMKLTGFTVFSTEPGMKVIAVKKLW